METARVLALGTAVIRTILREGRSLTKYVFCCNLIYNVHENGKGELYEQTRTRYSAYIVV